MNALSQQVFIFNHNKQLLKFLVGALQTVTRD
jgi:hypothetical protein